jgi:hypothetical protein
VESVISAGKTPHVQKHRDMKVEYLGKYTIGGK